MPKHKVGDIVTIEQHLIMSSRENPVTKGEDASVLHYFFGQPLRIEAMCTCPEKHYKLSTKLKHIVERSAYDVWIPSAYVTLFEDVPISIKEEDICNILQE